MFSVFVIRRGTPPPRGGGYFVGLCEPVLWRFMTVLTGRERPCLGPPINRIVKAHPPWGEGVFFVRVCEGKWLTM